ncbi:hypothetical protein B5E65_13165 [Gemmiger sp. An120]|nr:hypothetical protein B5E65_13165 [Gemmiger sp. An120]
MKLIIVSICGFHKFNYSSFAFNKFIPLLLSIPFFIFFQYFHRIFNSMAVVNTKSFPLKL